MPLDKPEHDYYEILQVHPKATPAVIKKAYRALLLEDGNHPDRGGDSAAAALITEAYRVLSHAERRAAYDRLYFGPGEPERASRETPRAEAPESALVVLCPRCRTKNRVRSQELLAVARCSRCKQSLNTMPHPLIEAYERARRWVGQVLGPAGETLAGPHKLLAIGVPALILIGSSLAGAYALAGSFAPRDPLELTDTLRREGHLDRAASLLQQALGREPGNPRLHEKLGDVYVKQELYEQAISEYEQALRLNPQNSYVYALEGNAYVALNRLDNAESSLKQALKLDPTLTPAMVELGNVYVKQDRFDDAIKLYQQALHDKPDADVFYDLGTVYKLDGKPDDAANAFLKALIADPNHRSSMVSLAGLYYDEGKLDQAAAQLVKASALKHDDIDLHMRLAQIYERTGRDKEAITEWETCLDQGHGDPTVLERAKHELERLRLKVS